MLKKKIFDPLDYTEPITKIFFVRHGETRANVKRLLFGHLDFDLTTNGIKQAKKAGANLAAYPLTFHYIISSPLKRARHTATIIAKQLVKTASTIIIDKNLTEKSEGIWEGKSFGEVRKEDPKNYHRWVKNPYKNKPPKGESVAHMNKRVEKFYKTVLRKYLGKNIIVVSHAGPIRLFILKVLGANINKFWHLATKCGSISEVHLSKKQAIMCSFNR